MDLRTCFICFDYFISILDLIQSALSAIRWSDGFHTSIYPSIYCPSLFRNRVFNHDETRAREIHHLQVNFTDTHVPHEREKPRCIPATITARLTNLDLEFTESINSLTYRAAAAASN